MVLGTDYYAKAVRLWEKGDQKKSLFFLGAALHLIQDVTIPQHVNIRLLDDHRQYETFVKRTFENVRVFQADHGAILLDSIEYFFRFNAKTALKIYRRYWTIENDEKRYYKITRCTLPLAERTTAGAMVLFYRQIKSIQ